jgi:hypothetical protein
MVVDAAKPAANLEQPTLLCEAVSFRGKAQSVNATQLAPGVIRRAALPAPLPRCAFILRGREQDDRSLLGQLVEVPEPVDGLRGDRQLGSVAPRTPQSAPDRGRTTPAAQSKAPPSSIVL